MLVDRRYGVMSLISKVPRPIKLVAAVMFFFELGFGFVDPWWAIYIDKITSNYLLTGVVIALFSVTGLLVALPLGQVIDQFNHKQIIRASLIMYLAVAALYFAAGYNSSIPLLILAVLVNGISSVIIYETSQAYIDRHYQGDKSFNYAFVVSLDALGYLVGTLAVLAVIAWWPIYYGYLVVAMFILFTLLIARRLPTTSEPAVNLGNLLSEIISKKILHRALQALPHYPVFFYVQIACIFFILFINFGFLVFLPLFGVEQHLSLIEVGLVAILFQVPIFLSAYYATLIERRAKRFIVLIFFCLIALLMMMFYIWHSSVAFYIISFFLSSALTILNITVRPVLFSLSPSHLEGEAASITKFAEKLATVTAPLIVGWLAAVSGINTSYVLFAVLAAILGVVSFYFYERYQAVPIVQVRHIKPIHRSGN